MNPFPRNSFPSFSPSCYEYNNTVHLLCSNINYLLVSVPTSPKAILGTAVVVVVCISWCTNRLKRRKQQQINVVCKWNLCAVTPVTYLPCPNSNVTTV